MLRRAKLLQTVPIFADLTLKEQTDIADELELVRSGLDDTMRDALQAMRVRWHEDEKVDDLRLSAYMIAIQKIALSYQSKSLG